jgi:prolyl oligopeptidase
MEIGSISTPAMRGNRYFLAKREGSQNQPVYYWREGARGKDRVLVDPAVLDPSGLTTIEWMSPSRNGKLAAYGTYKAGDENTTLYLIEVDTGKTLPLEIPNKTQGPDWLPDGSGFVYQNLKNPKDPYTGQVMFHRMGEAVSTSAGQAARMIVKSQAAWGRDTYRLALGRYATSARTRAQRDDLPVEPKA